MIKTINTVMENLKEDINDEDGYNTNMPEDIDVSDIYDTSDISDFKAILHDYINSLDQEGAKYIYYIIVSNVNDEDEDEIEEGLHFKTKKAELQRWRKANPLAVKKAKKAAKKYYKQNKAKIKMKQKLYKKKSKTNPNMVRHHV